MQYYLFGDKSTIAPYTMLIGSFDTRREAEQVKRRLKEIGWSNLKIKKMDWL